MRYVLALQDAVNNATNNGRGGEPMRGTWRAVAAVAVAA
jgi:hypothetical protein